MLNGIEAVFPTAKLYGCWFHFNQAIIRYLFDNCGLKTLYLTNFEFKLWIRKLSAFSFISKHDILLGWDNILDTIPCDLHKSILKFIKYFVNNWLKGPYGPYFNNYENNARYPTINGLLSTDIYLLDRPMFNPDVLLENIFIQVVHAENHWVTVSNYNPNFKSNELNCWYVYDSINSANYYLQKIKHFLKLINGGSRYMTICNIPVVQQIGYDDCGLFALGYALALAMDIDPGSIYFDQ
ncbi:unnamed protein product, partial [Brachionus calyciflorus]